MVSMNLKETWKKISEEKPKKLLQACYELVYLGTGHGRFKCPKSKNVLFPKAGGKFLNHMSETQEENKQVL